MFKNKALFVQMVPSTYTTDEPQEFLNPEWIDKTIKDQVNHVALIVVSVLAANVALKTMSYVIVKRVPTKK